MRTGLRNTRRPLTLYIFYGIIAIVQKLGQQPGASMDYLGLIFVVVGYSFLGWCLWVANPKHPERLEKLRKALGVTKED